MTSKMVKVELLIPRAGDGFSHNRGDVVDVPEDEAKRLFESVPPKAKPVRGASPAIETTSAKPAPKIETAAAPRKTPKQRRAVKTTKAGKTR